MGDDGLTKITPSCLRAGRPFHMLLLRYWCGCAYFIYNQPVSKLGSPGGSDSKESACNAGDSGSTPGSGRSLGKETGSSLQYCCLENPMDRAAWRPTVHGTAKNQTQLSNEHTRCLNYEAQWPWSWLFLYFHPISGSSYYLLATQSSLEKRMKNSGWETQYLCFRENKAWLF